MIKYCLLFILLLFALLNTTKAQRTETLFDDNWKFNKDSVTNAEAGTYNDAVAYDNTCPMIGVWKIYPISLQIVWQVLFQKQRWQNSYRLYRRRHCMVSQTFYTK